MTSDAITMVMADPFGSCWPDSLVSYLNAEYDPDAAWVKRYKAHVPDWRQNMPWADPAVAARHRHRQREVRDIVDFLLRENNHKKAAARVDRLLTEVKVTPALDLRSQLGLPPGPDGTPFTLHWWRFRWPTQKRFSRRAAMEWNRRAPFRDADNDRDRALVDLVRLLDSSLWRALRKCPECATYFLARSHRGKKYCSKKCMWSYLQRRRRSRMAKPDKARALKQASQRRREVFG